MLREDLQNALKEAMKNKDMKTVNAVRLIIAGQKEKDVEARGKGQQQASGAVRMIIAGMKEKDVDARGKGQERASDSDLLSMMQTMIKQRNESIRIYIEGNRQDLADKEQDEIDVITKFMPKQMNEQEIEDAIKNAISVTNASSIKDMGKVMGILKGQYAGQMDFSVASATIKKFLA